jgi:hypothetical protein
MFQSAYELEARIKASKPRPTARRELMPISQKGSSLSKLVRRIQGKVASK